MNNKITNSMLRLLVLTVVAVTAFTASAGFPISIQSMTGGSVVADKATAEIGETVTLTVTPNAGYALTELTVLAGYEPIIDDDEPDYAPPRPHNAPAVSFIGQGNVEVTRVDDVHYTFVLPESFPNALTENYVSGTEFRVSATFEATGEPTEPTYSVTVAKAENCTVLPGVNAAAEGETVTVTLTGDDGATFKSFNVYTVYEVEGGSDPARGPRRMQVRNLFTDVTTVTEGAEYSFVMPAQNIEIEAVFEGAAAPTYTVTVLSATNGSATVDKANAAEGETVTISATPADGYEVDAVTIYEVSGSGFLVMQTEITSEVSLTRVDATHYTFIMKGVNTRVKVTFKEAPVMAITFADALTLNEGDEATISDLLTVAQITEDGMYAYVSDGQGNWARLAGEAVASLNAGVGVEKVSGTLSALGVAPTITLSAVPELTTGADVQIGSIDLTRVIAELPLPCQVVTIRGWYDGLKLRAYSSNSGQQGQGVIIDASHSTAALEVGKEYQATVAVELIEAWEAEQSVGAPCRVKASDATALANIKVSIISSDATIETGITDLNADSDATVRYYDINGRYVGSSLDGVARGLYIGTDGKKVVK